MLAIAFARLFAGGLLLAAAPQTQSYLISLEDTPVGFATLSIERISQKDVRYSWDAELQVSGDPCLRSAEKATGKIKLNDPVLPEEVFVALAPDIGTGCHKIRGADPAVAPGQGCWTEASSGHAEGTLFGNEVKVNYGAGTLMPVEVRYPKLGLVYRAAAQISDDMKECQHTVADDGVSAQGGRGLVAGSVDKATYKGDTAADSATVVRSRTPLPPAVVSAIAAVRGHDLKSCRQAAESLAKALKARHLQTRLVSGLLLDQGRYYPHAWLEVKVGKDWVPLDATTDDAAADASHLKLGMLDDFQSGIEMLKALHAPPTVTVEE